MKKERKDNNNSINNPETASCEVVEKKTGVDTLLYNENSLNLLTIRDLRDIGRKFGVPSPTTLSKSDLINYILKIVYGKAAPVRNSLGRPNVREFNMQSYLDRIRKNAPIASKLSKVRLYDDNLELKVSSSSSEYISNGDSIQTKVFCETDKGYVLRTCAYIEAEDDLKVSAEFVKKYKLENYDVLEILEFGGLIKILTINGICTADKFHGMLIAGEPIVSGTNKDFYISTKEERTQVVKEIEKVCIERGITLLVFSQNKYEGENTKSIQYSTNCESSVIYKKFMSLVGECERILAECGDILVLVENKQELDSALDSFAPDVRLRIKTNLDSELSKFAKLGNVVAMLSEEDNSLY